MDGKKVVTFGLAVSKKMKDKKVTSFFDCEAWAHTADLIEKYFKKGDQILLEAEARQETWQNAEGQKRSKVKFVVQNVTFTASGKSKEAVESTDSVAQEDPVDAHPF